MPLLKRWPAAQQMIVKLAGRAICLDLGERLLITVARIFDELFVYPASPMVAPPYHSPNEPTGNRSSRHDYPPEMPGVGPPLVRATAESVSLLTRYPKEAEPGGKRRLAATKKPLPAIELPSCLRAAQQRNGTRRRSERASTRCPSCRRAQPPARRQRHRVS